MRMVVLFPITALVFPLYATGGAEDRKPLSGAEQEITWNFETGDLRGWTATGDAFSTQPTYGDNPTARHRGQPPGYEGEYRIGGYENRPKLGNPPGRICGDGPQGTLTSGEFIITVPVISFLVGGGCDVAKERVELLVDGNVHYKTTGRCTETMERRCWNVAALRGKEARIRLVDAGSDGWGHINFDDVRFAGTFDQDVNSISTALRCSSLENISAEPGHSSPDIKEIPGTPRSVKVYRTIRVR
jgi:hypothetical protein